VVRLRAMTPADSCAKNSLLIIETWSYAFCVRPGHSSIVNNNCLRGHNSAFLEVSVCPHRP
jgi:hypothetical protein